MIRSLLSAAAVAALLVSAPAAAQQPDAQTMQEMMHPLRGGIPEDAPALTEERVEMVLNAMRALKEEYGSEVEPDPSMYDEIEDDLEDLGFDSVNDWAIAWKQVFRGIMALSITPEERAQMRQAREEIMNSDMPEVQKQQMMAMMGGQLSFLAEEPPEMDVVRPYYDEFKTLLEMEE